MTLSEKILGVRPYRLPSESLTGYLLRLAYLNGFNGLSDFLWTIGMKPRKNRRMNYFTEKELAHLHEPLSKALGRSADRELENSFKIPWEFDSYRVFQHALVDFPRICPQCLSEQESPSLNWRWQCAFIPLCPTHNTPLVNQCPDCNKMFGWKDDIFECCPSCNKAWSCIELEKVDSLSEINQLVWPLADGSISLNNLKLRDVMLALMIAGRPKDVLRQPLIAVPETSEHWCYALRALKLLVDNSYFDTWSVMANSTWQNAQFTPSILFIQQLQDGSWPIQDEEKQANSSYADLCLSTEELETTAYIKPSRVLGATRHDEADWYTHLSHTLLSRFLGIKSKTLTVLTDADLLPQMNSTAVVRDKLFDAAVINRFLNQRFTQKVSGAIRIGENHLCFRRYLSSYGELLAAWLRGELQIDQVNEGDLSEVYVSKEVLDQFLKSQYTLACQDHLGISRVASCLGIPSPKVEEYVTQGHFHYAAARFDRLIYGPSFAAYYTPPRFIHRHG